MCRVTFGAITFTTLCVPGSMMRDTSCGWYSVPPFANAAYASASCSGVASRSP